MCVCVCECGVGWLWLALRLASRGSRNQKPRNAAAPNINYGDTTWININNYTATIKEGLRARYERGNQYELGQSLICSIKYYIPGWVDNNLD